MKGLLNLLCWSAFDSHSSLPQLENIEHEQNKLWQTYLEKLVLMTFTLSSPKLLHKDDWIHIWLKLSISLATSSSEKTFVLTKWLVLKGSKPRTKRKLKLSKKDKTIGTFSHFQFRAMISFNPDLNLTRLKFHGPKTCSTQLYIYCVSLTRN